MKSRVHPKYKTTYRVGNWPAYDRALVQRGDVTLWLAPEAIARWEAAGVGKRGGQLQYSDVAIETADAPLALSPAPPPDGGLSAVDLRDAVPRPVRSSMRSSIMVTS